MTPRSDNITSARLQAVHLVSWMLTAIMALTAFTWATSNIREISPQNRAVVFRFGAVDRVQDSGLLWAWPAPIERAVLLPAAATVLERQVAGLLRSPAAQNLSIEAVMRDDALAGSGYLLTADASAVHLDIRIFYKVSDPVAYVVQGEHVVPALDRVATRSAVLICASRDLDGILVARPELVGSDSNVAEKREQLRADLVRDINDRLRELARLGSSLGIEVERADVQSVLPDAAVGAFDAVLTASQEADQAIASARNEAEKDRQMANQEADRIFQVAQAQSSERISKARADTASINGYANQVGMAVDPGLLWRIYRDRIAQILPRAGSVVTVDPKDDAHLILQGADK